MAGTGQLRGEMFCEDENVLLLMGPLKQGLGDGWWAGPGGGDLKVFLLICFHWFQWEQAALAWGHWGSALQLEVRSGSLLWRG